VGWLFYSDRLVELPLGVFAIAIATVIMPSLSRQHAASSPEQFSKILDWAIKLILLIALPATVALVILAEPIIITLFQHGKLTLFDAMMSARSLQAYALGLLGFMLIKVLAPGYFARQDMKTPVRIGMISIAANIGFKMILVMPLLYWFGLGHVGLALATAMAAYVNAGLLFRGLRRAGVYVPSAQWGSLWLRYGLVNLAMALVLLVLLLVWNDWAVWAWWQRVAHLSLMCAAGAVTYVVGLWLVGVRARDFKSPV